MKGRNGSKGLDWLKICQFTIYLHRTNPLLSAGCYRICCRCWMESRPSLGRHYLSDEDCRTIRGLEPESELGFVYEYD